MHHNCTQKNDGELYKVNISVKFMDDHKLGFTEFRDGSVANAKFPRQNWVICTSRHQIMAPFSHLL